MYVRHMWIPGLGLWAMFRAVGLGTGTRGLRISGRVLSKGSFGESAQDVRWVLPKTCLGSRGYGCRDSASRWVLFLFLWASWELGESGASPGVALCFDLVDSFRCTLDAVLGLGCRVLVPGPRVLGCLHVWGFVCMLVLAPFVFAHWMRMQSIDLRGCSGLSSL